MSQPRELIIAHEVVETIHLSQCAGCLHITDLEVVTQMAVRIFVIVANGQTSEFVSEPFTA